MLGAVYGLRRRPRCRVDIEVNGASVHIGTGNKEIDPNKETVVFVHGAGQDHTIWVLPVRYFVRHGRNALSVDLPGHGMSGGEAISSVEEMTDWLTAVLDAVGIEKAAIVGHSMGSLVALEMAARHPDRVRSIALVGTSIPMPVSEELLENAKNDDYAALEMLTYWSNSTKAEIGGNPTPGIWIVGSYIRLLERAGPGVIYAGLKACHDYVNGLDHAKKVDCPALLILGERDAMTPTRAAQAVVDALPDAEVIVMKNTGHNIVAERPDPMLDALITVV